MPHYELIYETGRHSVANYDDDTQMKQAVREHHERAKAGLPSLSEEPNSPSAERIAVVHKYDTHPADYKSDQLESASTLKASTAKLIDELTTAGKAPVDQLALAVRNLSSPHADKKNPQDSMYLQKAQKTFTPTELGLD